MSYYISRLVETTEREAVELSTHNERLATQAARERLTPLEERLSRLLASIPSEIQHEGLSLAVLQRALRGRWRGNCHPGELGAALRKLGFTRQRKWNGENGFRALWYPD